MSTRFPRTCVYLLVFFALVGARAKSSDDQPWRVAFDEAYGLDKGQALRHVPPPLIPERLDFYKWAAKAQAEAVPEGPAVMTVRWAGDNPRFGTALFSVDGRGLRLREVLASVVGLKSDQVDGPRELLDLELPGDWSVRYRAPQSELLEGLAKRLSEITARNISFRRETAEAEVVVAKGTPKRPADLPADDTWPLDLDLAGTEFLSTFGGAGRMEHLLNTLAQASGWPVVNEIDPHPGAHQVLSWSGERVTEDDNLERIPRAQLDHVINSIARETGLELTVERRKVERWKLVQGP